MPKSRSEIMRSVGRSATGAELRVRELLDAAGVRYETNVENLPGSPDVVLPDRKLCLFVHGCFWHRHPGCKKTTTPKTNREFWTKKFEANVRRDRRIAEELRALGWEVVVIWECETEDPETLRRRLSETLGLRF